MCCRLPHQPATWKLIANRPRIYDFSALQGVGVCIHGSQSVMVTLGWYEQACSPLGPERWLQYPDLAHLTGHFLLHALC